MSIVPLKQTVIHSKLIGTDPDYGDPYYGPPTPLKCRFQEGSKLVRNQKGEEVVCVGTFHIDKLADVDYGDILVHTDERLKTTVYTPQLIGVKRHISGKPLLTEVDV